MDQVYDQGRSLFFDALKRFGLKPTSQKLWTRFKDTHEDESDRPPAVTEQIDYDLAFLKDLRGPTAKLWGHPSGSAHSHEE